MNKQVSRPTPDPWWSTYVMLFSGREVPLFPRSTWTRVARKSSQGWAGVLGCFRAPSELNDDANCTRHSDLPGFQNIAEIDEIATTFHTIEVVLPAAERAIYLELEHFLRALEMTIKRGGKKTESDREKRVAKSLGDSRYVFCRFIC